MSRLVGSAAIPAVSPLRTLAAQPSRRVLMIIGDSNFAGFSASSDNATGFRSALQRVLQEEGIRFRMVGRGFGALNSTGTTWGRFPNVDDFHDKPIPHLADPRHWGFGGRRLSLSNAVTVINAGTGTFTVPGHTLTVGVACTLDTSGMSTPLTMSVVQPVYYAATVSGNDITLAQYEGSTTPLSIANAGSGTLRINEGLNEMLPGIAEACDETPTDIIAGGGTNDVSALISGGASVAAALVILKARELVYEEELLTLFPYANIHRVCLLDFMDDTQAAIDASSLVHQFNSWLVERGASLGRRWNVIDATSIVPGSAYADNVHLLRNGYEAWGQEIARQVAECIGRGPEGAKVPRPFVRRSAQACIELRATTEKATFPAQTALNPGSDSFFFAIWFMPFALPTGTNVIVQQESPYNDGCMLTHNGTGLNLYHKSAGAGAVIAITGPPGYTHCLKQYRWHRLVAFFDTTRNQAALFCNGKLLQRVNIGSASITSQDGWCLGAISSFASALGLYQGFTVGHGASLSIEDFREQVEADYYDNEDPPGTTYKAKLDEGTGTSLASTVHDTTAGTLSAPTGGWVASGLYPKRPDDGYKQIVFSGRRATVTAAYTATYGEIVLCDPTSAGFTVSLPTAVGHDGEQVLLVNASASTNAITIDPNGSETINGSTTITGINTARGSRLIEARGGNWITVAAS